METKICTNVNCIHQGQPQPITNFRNRKKAYDGKSPQCNDCMRVYAQRYKENGKRKEVHDKYNRSDKFKATQERYIQSEKGQETHRRYLESKREKRAIARQLRESQKEPYIQPTEKICPNPKCIRRGKLQPLDNFNNYNRNKDGKQSWCRDCQKAEHKEYVKSGRNKIVQDRYRQTERFQETRKKYLQSEQAKISYRKRNQKYSLDPVQSAKILARNKLNKAVRAGKIPHVSTQKCINCKEQAHHYHHYLGYEPEHWYDVVSLCYGCHDKYHRGLVEINLSIEYV